MAQTERKIEIEIRAKTEKALSEINRLNKELNKLKKTEKDFKKLDSQVKQMSRSFSQLAVHVGKLAVIYGTFQGLNNTVRTFAEFEHSINRLGVISGATATELQALEDKAKSLGESTIFSASQVADGMNSLAMAGLSADEQLQAIGGTLDLSTIGMLDLNEASLIAVRTMGSFNMEAKDVAYITDIMAVASTDSTQSISELGSAYEKVGSIATAYGISLEEVTASLEVMADAGRVGTDAGTQLKIVMGRLAGNKEAKKYLDELGVSIYDANGKIKPFNQQLKELKVALDKLPDGQRNLKLGQLFGSEAIGTAILLLNSLDDLDAKAKKLANSFGVANANAKKLQDDLQGSYKALMSALEGLAIRVGNELTPALKNAIDDATLFIRTLDKADIEKFGQDIANTITFIKSLVTATAELIGTIAGVSKSISDVTGISSGWVVIIGGLILKLRGSLIPAIKNLRLVLLALGTVNPYILALSAGLLAIEYATDQLNEETMKLNKSTDEYIKSIGGLQDMIEGLALGFDQLDLEGVRVGITSLGEATDIVKSKIRKLKEELAKEKDSWWGYWVDEEKITRLTNQIDEYEEALADAEVMNKKLKDRGNELTKSLKDQKTATEDATKATKTLTDEEKKFLDKTESSLTTRKASLETALGQMLQKEKSYYAKIANLEAKTAQIRKKYSDERVALELSVNSSIANVYAKGLDDYGKYKDAQKRADEAYTKAKEYLEKGNLELSQKYLDEYNSLIQMYAGEEIKTKETVMKYNKNTHKFEREEIEKTRITAHSTAVEYENDAKKYKDLKTQIINSLEAREIDANNKAIESEKLKLAMLKAEIQIQKQMLELVNQMLEKTTGIKIDLDFGDFDKVIADTEKQLENLENKKRHIKIDGADTTEVDKDLQKIDNDKIQPDVKPKVDEKPYIEFKRTVVNDELVAKVKADKEEASAEVARLEAEIAKQGTKPVDLELQKALAQARQLEAELSRTVTKVVYIQEHYLPARKNGGLIQKFNTGGVANNLENGQGHSRKTGKLNGYGGGDKIKALLEAGEFIVRKEAVRAIGLDKLYQINQGVIPKYQFGGEVGSIPRFNSGGLATQQNNSSNRSVELNLNLGGNTYKTYTDDEVATALAEHLQRSTF